MNKYREQRESAMTHESVAKTQSEIYSLRQNNISQARTQDLSNKQSKPSSLQAPTVDGSVKGKKTKKKDLRTQSSKGFQESNSFTVDPNHKNMLMAQQNVLDFEYGPQKAVINVDSLQDEYDHINNDRKIDLINASIKSQKRAQSSASNYNERGQTGGQVTRQKTQKQSKTKKQTKKMDVQVNEVDMLHPRTKNNTQKLNDLQDYGNLSYYKHSRNQGLGLSDQIPSENKRSQSLNKDSDSARKNKRENSAFSRFSNSIRSSLGNMFSKNSNKIQIAPIHQDQYDSDVKNIKKQGNQDYDNSDADREVSRIESKNQQNRRSLQNRTRKQSNRYDANAIFSSNGMSYYENPSQIEQHAYQNQTQQLNHQRPIPLVPIGTVSNQALDKEEMKMKIRQQLSGRRNTINDSQKTYAVDHTLEQSEENFRLRIESGCYNTNVINSVEQNQRSQPKLKESSLNITIHEEQTPTQTPDIALTNNTQSMKDNAKEKMNKTSMHCRNSKLILTEDPVHWRGNSNQFFKNGMPVIGKNVDSDEKAIKRLKMQRIKFSSSNNKDKDIQPNLSFMSPNGSIDGQQQILGWRKSNITNGESIKSDATKMFNDSNQSFSGDMNRIKVNRDKNGKLKLKLNSKKNSDGNLVVNSAQKSRQTSQTNLSEKINNLQDHDRSTTEDKLKETDLHVINEKQLASTIDHRNRKLKHAQSAIENTIQAKGRKSPDCTPVYNNNFTRNFQQQPTNDKELRVTPSILMQSQAGNVMYACSNHLDIPGHDKAHGLFYCMNDHKYLCESCMIEHRHHVGLDSVKNHLVNLFDEWCALLSHMQNHTQSIIITNITKGREILLNLKKNAIELPDIDVFKLRIVFSNLQRRLQRKINEIRDICKHNDLEKVIGMHQDLIVFTYQIRELEERSSMSGMMSNYCNQNDEDLKLYQGLSNQRQNYLLRRQFDDRMKKLAQLSLAQRIRIQKYEHYIENSMVEKEAALIEKKQDFQSQFNNIFEQKVEQIRSQKLINEQLEVLKRQNSFSCQQQADLQSRNSLSTSVQDINDMIDSLNNNLASKQNEDSGPSQSGEGIVKNSITFDNRPKMKLNINEKLSCQKSTLGQDDCKSPDRKPHLSSAVSSVKGINLSNISKGKQNYCHLSSQITNELTNQKKMQMNHNKQQSLVSQISDFNKSIKCNQNYESIMKNTRQKIIQSHMMQSANKQKPYYMRLSTIFGDKSVPGVSPVGHNFSNFDAGKTLFREQSMNSNGRKLSAFSPFQELQQNKGEFVISSPQVPIDSNNSSLSGTLNQLILTDIQKEAITNISNNRQVNKQNTQQVDNSKNIARGVALAQNLHRSSLNNEINNIMDLQQISSGVLSPIKHIKELTINDQKSQKNSQKILVETNDYLQEDQMNTPLFSLQLQQEIIDTFNANITNDNRTADSRKVGVMDNSSADYEELCNLNESIRMRLQTAQIVKEMSKHSISSSRPPLNKKFSKQKVNQNESQKSTFRKNNLPVATNLNLSQSRRVVDWSDKLKHMEIKDVMDIDICHMTQDLNKDSDKDDDFSPDHFRKSLIDDSFSHYLEKLKQEDDQFREEDELNYNLDQLGSYQSCYIDNKTPIKNRGPVPDDIISHLDYLDEGVLIMQPQPETSKPRLVEKGLKTKGAGLHNIEIVRLSNQMNVKSNGSSVEASPFTRLLSQQQKRPPVPQNTNTNNTCME